MKHSTARVRRLHLVALLGLLTACGDGVTGATRPSGLTLLGGNGQPGVVGEALPNPVIVKVTDASGKALRGVTVQWTVTSGSGSVTPSSASDAEGLATAQWVLGTTPGEQSITASVEGVTPVHFNTTAAAGRAAAVVVAPDSAVLPALNDTLRLAARIRDRFGNLLASEAPQWNSLDTAIIRVDPSGLVHARSNGTGRIVAAAAGTADTVVVRVRQVVAVLTLTPAADTLLVGGRVRVVATGRDRNGFVIADARPVWASSDPAAVSVDSSGLAEARARGTSIISASVGAVSAQASIRVVQAVAGPLATGYAHSCAITAGGTAYCWGSNSHGALGAPSSDCGGGNDACSTVPIEVSGGLRFHAISNGQGWTCAVTASGDPYCWGNNVFGALGNGTTTLARVPTRVSGGLSLRAIAAGGSHSCGLTAGGSAYCWGSNNSGQLGDGTTIGRTAPARVSTTQQFKSLALGNSHSCAVTTADELFCWGANSYAQLGDGTTVDRLTPALVPGVSAVASASAGNAHTCALTMDGSAFCWGDGTFGQLGTGALTQTCSGWYGTVRCRTTPTRVSSTLVFSHLTAGLRHTCAVAAGRAYCWGENSTGALGAATPDQCGWGSGFVACRNTPGPVQQGDLAFATISAGQLYTCAATGAGAVYCWGWNGVGQVGDGSLINRASPARTLMP